MRRIYGMTLLCCLLLSGMALAVPRTMLGFTPTVARFNGVLYLPARALSELLGATRVEIPATGATTLKLGGNTFACQPNSTAATANGAAVTLPAAPFALFHGGLAVPAMACVQALGATEVQANRTTMTVTFPGAEPLTLEVEDAQGDASQCYDSAWILFSINVDGTDLRHLSYCSYGGMGAAMPGVSPDGTLMAYYTKDGMLVVRPIDKAAEKTVTRLGGYGIDFIARFSPDNSALFYTENQQHITQVQLADGKSRTLCPGWQFQLSPDGKFLAASGQNELLCVRVADGARESLAGAHVAIFTPDSSALIYSKRITTADGETINQLVRLQLTGPQAGASRPIPTKFGSPGLQPRCVTPDGKQLIAIDGMENRVILLNLDGTAERVLVTAEEPTYTGAWVTPDGKAVILHQGEGDLVRVNLDGTGIKNLTKGMMATACILLPDGARLLFLAQPK